MTASIVEIMGDYNRSAPDTLYSFWVIPKPSRMKRISRGNSLDYAVLWDVLV